MKKTELYDFLKSNGLNLLEQTHRIILVITRTYLNAKNLA